MKRKIIEIDESKCNGCGLCIPNCPEGALQVIDGKARLVGDLFCDGLGACIGECPAGAIRTVEREAEPYDERRVMTDNIIPKGSNTIAAHLKHLRDHGESELHRTALDVLAEKGMAVPAAVLPHPGGCPGRMARLFNSRPRGGPAGGASALRQWPIQLKLLNPAAEYFDQADLLISADCVAHAYGAFHQDLLDGKILIVFCPKLDGGLDGYADKLTEIFSSHEIRSVTAARMTVPCCGGTVELVRRALRQSGKDIELNIRIVDLDGTLKT